MAKKAAKHAKKIATATLQKCRCHDSSCPTIPRPQLVPRKHSDPRDDPAEGEDSLKKMQLMELAILNGTYRDANIKSPALAFSLAATAQAPRIITGPAPVLPPAALRTPTPAGPTIMPLIRQIQTAVMPNGTPHPTAAIVPPGPEAGLIYTPYEYPYTLAPATSILEYPIEPSGVLGAVATKVRRHDMRVHPYQRIVTADRG
ncbi:Protein quaking [Varanus komodoensis]|nr:Protein quaking [Varanus komodoensis]